MTTPRTGQAMEACVFEYQPELTDDPSRNAAVLRKLLAAEHPGRVSVPPGRWPVAVGRPETSGTPQPTTRRSSLVKIPSTRAVRP
ncbi:MAG: hypothetical protein GEV09_28445 [Pseudonocardiaceae bacterium]|nr:hypothetical protein [Pseudonocardiaceae bacterium]